MRWPVLAALVIAAAPAASSAQTIEWVRQFGTAAQDRAFAVAVNASGVYVAGATEGTLPGQRSAGAIDAFVRKYNTNSTEIWTRQFGTAGIDEILAIAADQTGVYVAGDTQGVLEPESGAPQAPHAFVRKYDLDGMELWTREFGSGRREEVLAIAAGAGAVYAAGDTTVTVPPFDDAFVVVLGGSDGKARGGHEFGTAAVDHAAAIAVNASGVYVAGATQGTLPGQAAAGDSDAFLRKYDLDGNEIWTRQFGTPASDEILSIALAASELYVAGITSEALAGQSRAGAVDAFLARYDFDGHPLWTRQFGTSAYDDALAVAIGPQGVFVAGNTAGVLPGQTGSGDYDAFVRTYDVQGKAGWTQQFGSSAHDEALAIATSGSDVYVAGVTEGALPAQRSNGSSDAFVVKLRAR